MAHAIKLANNVKSLSSKRKETASTPKTNFHRNNDDEDDDDDDVESFPNHESHSQTENYQETQVFGRSREESMCKTDVLYTRKTIEQET